MPKKQARSTWGTKRKSGNNSWELRYTVNGVRRAEYFRGTSKEADRRLAELRIQYEGISEESLTLATFWSAYYEKELDEKAPQTQSEYRRVWKNDIEPMFGDKKLDAISPREIQTWLDGMTKSKAKHSKAVLSSMLSRAFALDLVDDNVCQRRYRMPKNNGRMRSHDVYTDEEMQEIFYACTEEVWEPAFILAAFGGASREESMGVKVSEISFDNGFAIIPIQRGVQRVDGRVIVNERTKNEYRERVLVIPKPYSWRLRQIVDEKLSNGDTWLMDDGFGNVLCPNNICQGVYKRWFIGKPYRYVTFGNLRKSYATAMQTKGMDNLGLSNMLGHSQLSTTYRHYDQPTIEQKMRQINRLDNN